MDAISAAVDAGRQSSVVRSNKKKAAGVVKSAKASKAKGKRVATQGKGVKGGEAKPTEPNAP
eukprot:1593881-Karenia_brevis.AAC.1